MQPYRILLVDDEPIQRRLERDILEASDLTCEVKEARNGREALEYLRRFPFDAVLLDKRMPVMDGDEVCRRVRHELQQSLLPLIMVTGTNSQEELAISFQAGATDFIAKPYTPLELMARIRAAVRTKRLTDQLESAESLLFTLARMVEAKDKTTRDHCSRLSHMAVVFGKALGLDSLQLDVLRRGGVLHDIGKLGIPDSILLKPEPLSEKEWAIMRQHTHIGAHLCDGLATMRDVVPIIRHHHERWDGSGYPDGLRGDDIPLLARVFQIVDIYDALVSPRPYKRPFTREEIIAIMREETQRGWRDPVLMESFIAIVERRSDELRLSPQHATTADELAFDAIIATGAIEWEGLAQ
jgi:putative two-component system response regulator